MKHKYPFHYYLFLFIALVISILFWIFVLKERMGQGGYAASLPTTALPSLPNNYYTIKPIDYYRHYRQAANSCRLAECGY